MSNRSSWAVFATSVGVVLMGLAGQPAAGGVVYVSLAADVELRGVRYTTELRVSNPTEIARSFTTHFIATNQNGTVRPDPFLPPSQAVPAGETRLFRGLTSGGSTGMVEINADQAWVFRARLVPVLAQVERDGAAVAIVSSGNLVPGGRASFVQGLWRNPNRTTALGIVNLSKSENECSAELIGPQAQPLIPPAVLRLPPLSHAFFPDVLGLVGVNAQTEGRLELTCQGAAFAFAHVLNATTGEVLNLTLSTTGDSTLTPPGAQTGCPEGALCFEEKGVFHVPTVGDQVWERVFPIVPGQVFGRLRLQLTVQNGGWDVEQPDGLHNLFWVYRNVWRSNNFGYANLRGPNRNQLTNTTNVNLPAGQFKGTAVSATTTVGRVYKVDYTYDTTAGKIETILTTLDGTEVARIVDTASASEIVTQGIGFTIWCGQTRSNAEVPTLGWTYSDLSFQLLP